VSAKKRVTVLRIISRSALSGRNLTNQFKSFYFSFYISLLRSIGCEDSVEIGVLHIVEDDGWTSVGTVELDVDVAERKTVDVTGEESVGRTLTEELGNLGILCAKFGIRFAMSLLYAATIAQLNVAETDVLERMTWHACDLDA